MKIYICSDIHNNFSKYTPQDKVDLVLCAGDITNLGLREPQQVANALKWLQKLSKDGEIATLYVPGNHDIDWKIRESSNFVFNILDGSYKMCSKGILIRGASLSTCYSSPKLATFWDNMTCNYAAEKAYYESILPCDVLLSHSPPSGDLGFCTVNREDYGSKELRKWIETHQPKLVVCGHIHSPLAREEMIGDTRVINVACQEQIIEL